MGRLEDLQAERREGTITDGERKELQRLVAERDEERLGPVKAPGEVPTRPEMTVRATEKKKSFGQKVKAVFIREDEKLKTRNRQRRASNDEKKMQKAELDKIFAKAEFKAAKKRAKKEGKKSGSGKKPKGFFGQLSKGLSGFTAASMSEAGQISTNIDLIGGGETGSRKSSMSNNDILGFGGTPRKSRGRKKQRKFDLNDIL